MKKQLFDYVYLDGRWVSASECRYLARYSIQAPSPRKWYQRFAREIHAPTWNRRASDWDRAWQANTHRQERIDLLVILGYVAVVSIMIATFVAWSV
jgi:hypothetical protein